MAARTNGTTTPQEVYQGVTITEFKNNTRSVYVEWFDRKMRFEYRPGALDDEHFAKLDLDEEPGKTHRDWMRGYFLRIVHSCPSLTMDNGDPFIITEDTEALLPMPLKNRVVNAITDDLLPKATPEKESSNTSSPVVDGG